MGKGSGAPRVYLREAIALSNRVLDRPGDEAAAVKIAVKIQALDEAIQHGAYKIIRRK